MLLKNKPKIGIIGVGYLGGATKYWFDMQKFPALFYDKYKGIGSLQELNKAELIFICLPTPFVEENDKGFDDSAVWDVLGKIKGEKIIIIKSTVLPGATEAYQKKFNQHKFLMNPEFLVAKTAIQDFLNPDRQIVGYTPKSKEIAKDILKILPKAPFEKIVPSTEAEMTKYFGNVFLASKVIFGNQMYDLCQKLGINYNNVKECAGADPRIGTSHFDALADGYRGYSGACLPKDTKSLIKFAEQMGLDLKLLRVVDEINEKLLKTGGEKNLHEKK